jgi:phenylacetate-CoA ligase
MLFNLTAKAYQMRQKWKNPRLAHRLREVTKHQWWPPEKLEELSWQKVQLLLTFAFEHVPYYRDMFRQIGAQPQDIRTPEDFRRLPLLTKEIIQEHKNRLIADCVDHRELLENHTGGSTGQMLTFYQDEIYWIANAADKALTYAMLDYHPGDRWAFMWGSDYDAPKGPWEVWKQRLCFNRLWINTFDLDWERLGCYIQELQKFSPKFLIGYVSSLTLLASYMQAHGIDNIKPQAIQSTAEALTAAQRQKLESTFGCKVFDRYGCREVGNIAQECEAHDGLHVLTETNYVEVIDNHYQPALPGEEGHIVVTNLHNYAFPFIRYDTRDIGVPTQTSVTCPCGRGLPKIARVIGRSADIIISPEGRLLHGEFFTHLFYGVPGVRQFQVVQQSRDKLLVRIVKGQGFQSASIDRLHNLILEHGSSKFNVEFEFPDKIPISTSGKYRFTLSSMSPSEEGCTPRLSGDTH